jgi:hypothetical protein
MFDNNIVVNNVYRKIKEIENLDFDQYKEINLAYLGKTTIFFAIILAAIFAFHLISVKYLIIASTIVASAISVGLFLEVRKTRIEFKESLLACQDVKVEIYDYLSKPHVQKQLVNFFQVTFNYRTIEELKKLFAIKEHVAAYIYIDRLIKRFLEIENQKNEQIRNQEICQNYELSIKKNSKPKLRLVQ